jgi:hypothetical protein
MALSIQCSFAVPLPSAQFGLDGTTIEPEENGLRNWTMVLPVLSYRLQRVMSRLFTQLVFEVDLVKEPFSPP